MTFSAFKLTASEVGLVGIEQISREYRNNGGVLEARGRVKRFVASGVKVGDLYLQIDDAEPLKLTSDSHLLWLPVSADGMKVKLLNKVGETQSLLAESTIHLFGGLTDWGYFGGGTIHLICSSHNDIAWFDTPEKTIERRDHASITPALVRMKKRDDVHFTMENVLYLNEYLERHPEKKEEIAGLTKAGRFDWGATYNQPYEGVLSGEQLVREVYLGAKFIRKHIPGTPARVAYNPDVPGRSIQMPQILSKAGIPYLVLSRHESGIFNWASPDGSRVLCWSMGHYGRYAGLQRSRDIDTFLSSVNNYTRKVAQEYKDHQMSPNYAILHSSDYIGPGDYDTFIDQSTERHSAMLDGKMPRKYIPPKSQYSSSETFFESLLEGKPTFDTITGERPNVWLYIHGPSHHWAISAKRDAGIYLPAAETFATVEALLAGNFKDYPSADLDKAWRGAIYPDHGWGGHNGHITDQVFKEKLELGRDIGKRIFERSIGIIAARVKHKRAKPITIFNALSWTRTSPATCTLADAGKTFGIVDAAGKPVPHQVVSEGSNGVTVCFIARDVPSLGYKAYYQIPERPTSNNQHPASKESSVENAFYKITLGKGGLAGIYDKELKKDILQTGKFSGCEIFTGESVGNGAGEFWDVQQPSFKGLDRVSAHETTFSAIESGPVFSRFSLEQKLDHATVHQEFMVYHAIKRIDCKVSLLGWDGTRSREFRMALPLNMKQGTTTYEVPMGTVTVGRDEIEVAGERYRTPCKFTHPREVQNFISTSSDELGVTMSSSVAVCDWIDPVKPGVSYPVLQPILLASRRSCHGGGNWYLQAGDHHYSFSIFSHAPGWRHGRRPAIEANNALQAVVGGRARPDADLPTEKSFFSVSADNVLISAVKKCDDDNSVIVRLYDIEGRDANATVETFVGIDKAEHTNIIEEEGKPLRAGKRSLKTKIGHHSIETFKLWTRR